MPPQDSFWSSSESSFRPHKWNKKLQRKPLEEVINPEEEPCATGWNLMGLLDHKGGIGTAARANIRALKDLVPQCRRISFPSARYKAQDAIDVPAIHGRNYLHFNPCSVGAGILERCPWFRQGTNIGFWAWETTVAPPWWLKYDPWMKQIWVPSQFVKDALLVTGFKSPIYVIPHAIAPQPRHVFPPKDKPLTFMVQFDGHSRMERKRPDLSLQAIQQAALRSGEQIHIIIKTHRQEEVAFAEYSNISVEVINQWLSDWEMSALWDRVDILVSLNRGEGFGLPMVEAMARGIPVVATHWGATVEYMHDGNSYPVCVQKLEPCADSGDAYFKTGCWAMPDVEHAMSQIIFAMRDIRSGRFSEKTVSMLNCAANHSFDIMKTRMSKALSDLC